METPIRIAVVDDGSFSNTMFRALAEAGGTLELVSCHNSVAEFYGPPEVRRNPALVIVNGTLLGEGTNRCRGRRLRAAAPVLEVVDVACARCPHRLGVVGPSARARGLPAQMPLTPEGQADLAICPNIVSRRCSAEILVAAIIATAREAPYADPLALGAASSEVDPDVSFMGVLTPRERDIASALLQGLSNKQIAHRLGMAVRTVGNRVSPILDKLHCASRSELIARYT